MTQKKKKGRNMILAAVLRRTGLTQKELAQLAGVSQSSVGAMLDCDDRMLPKTRAKIANAVAALCGHLKVPVRVPEAPEAVPVKVWADEASARRAADGMRPSLMGDKGWRPQYWHEDTEEWIDLSHSVSLDEAATVAHSVAEDSDRLTRVLGIVCGTAICFGGGNKAKAVGDESEAGAA